MAYQIDGDDEQNRMQVKFYPRVKLVTLGWGQKVKSHLFSVNMSISKIFIPNFVCVVQMKDTKNIRQNFHSVILVMPQGWDFGALGVPRGVNNFFLNMVMWHIKLTGMTSRTKCK